MFNDSFLTFAIRVVEISKGIDRFRKCPVPVRKSEAPFRRSFGIMRNGQVFDGQQWEEWEKWSMRQITRKCEAMRMMITVFAGKPEDKYIPKKREYSLEEEDKERSKRAKLEENDPG